MIQALTLLLILHRELVEGRGGVGRTVMTLPLKVHGTLIAAIHGGKSAEHVSGGSLKVVEPTGVLRVTSVTVLQMPRTVTIWLRLILLRS